MTRLLPTLVLTLSLLALASWLFMMTADPPGIDPRHGGAAEQDAARSTMASGGLTRVPEITAQPLDAFSEVVERPLFNRTRRPVENPPADIESGVVAQQLSGLSGGNPDDLTLVGVVISAGEASALISLANDEPIRLAVGDRIDGWQIDAIEPRSVVLTHGGNRHAIDLKDNKLSEVEKRRLAREITAVPANAAPNRRPTQRELAIKRRQARIARRNQQQALDDRD